MIAILNSFGILVLAVAIALLQLQINRMRK